MFFIKRGAVHRCADFLLAVVPNKPYSSFSNASVMNFNILHGEAEV